MKALRTASLWWVASIGIFSPLCASADVAGYLAAGENIGGRGLWDLSWTLVAFAFKWSLLGLFGWGGFKGVIDGLKKLLFKIRGIPPAHHEEDATVIDNIIEIVFSLIILTIVSTIIWFSIFT